MVGMEVRSEILMQALMETLENIAFMEIRDCGDDGEPDTETAQDFHQASLHVYTPVRGRFTLQIAKELLHEMIGTIYVSETEPYDEALENDMLAEILNTIAGLVMHQVTPAGQTFALGLPQTEEEAMQQEDGPVLCRCLCEGRYLSVSWYLDPNH